ncbi:MAG: hypothetical protein IJ664_09080, partial [Clostridia bacterium]|nr:hypothetical protein [Clostridia bacterium]
AAQPGGRAGHQHGFDWHKQGFSSPDNIGLHCNMVKICMSTQLKKRHFSDNFLFLFCRILPGMGGRLPAHTGGKGGRCA